jgi:lipoprotein-anchoring transpeptidase ErfK/SrfK
MSKVATTRRSILVGGMAAGLSVLFGRASADALRVPRTHGPTTRRTVARATGEQPGTILISNRARTLDVVLDAQKVARYRIGIGRDGFTWTGTVRVGGKAEWPSWRPPSEMRQRQPKLPEMVPPGPFNPLGARALYLFRGGRDTLYRIHGTNDAATVGGYVTSGCFRMTNADILELYRKTAVGTTVIVSN